MLRATSNQSDARTKASLQTGFAQSSAKPLRGGQSNKFSSLLRASAHAIIGKR